MCPINACGWERNPPRHFHPSFGFLTSGPTRLRPPPPYSGESERFHKPLARARAHRHMVWLAFLFYRSSSSSSSRLLACVLVCWIRYSTVLLLGPLEIHCGANQSQEKRGETKQARQPVIQSSSNIWQKKEKGGKLLLATNAGCRPLVSEFSKTSVEGVPIAEEGYLALQQAVNGYQMNLSCRSQNSAVRCGWLVGGFLTW